MEVRKLFDRAPPAALLLNSFEDNLRRIVAYQSAAQLLLHSFAPTSIPCHLAQGRPRAHEHCIMIKAQAVAAAPVCTHEHRISRRRPSQLLVALEEGARLRNPPLVLISYHTVA